MGRYRRVRWKPLLSREVLSVNACVVSILCPSQVSFDDAFGNVEIRHVAANLHRAGAAAPTVTRSQARPAQRRVHATLKRVTLLQLLLGGEALDGILNEQNGVVFNVDGSEALLGGRLQDAKNGVFLVLALGEPVLSALARLTGDPQCSVIMPSLHQASWYRSVLSVRL
jgi:hypothetical protein